MNKHTKLAIIIAPFLLIGGYILADYYTKSQHEKKKFVYEMSLDDKCNITEIPCTLSSRTLQLKLMDKNSVTSIESNVALNLASIVAVDKYGKTTEYKLDAGASLKQWSAYTSIREVLRQQKDVTIRVVAVIGQSYYIKEIPLNPEG